MGHLDSYGDLLSPESNASFSSSFAPPSTSFNRSIWAYICSTDCDKHPRGQKRNKETALTVVDMARGDTVYLSIPLITIGIRLGAIGLYVLTAGVNPQINMNLWYMSFLDFLIAVVGGPIAEETGWRGYALPRMQKTRSALISSLIIGMLWTFWHAPGFLIPGMALPAVPFDWLVVLNYLLRVMSLSVLFTWLFNNTRRSIFVAFLFHTAVNSVPRTLFRIFSFGTISADVIFWVTWFTVGLQWLLVAFLVAVFGSARLSRKQIDD